MIRPIMRDPMFLSQPSADADQSDRQTAIDLAETLQAHAHECVGMAANMIGVRKRIIAVSMGGLAVVMINPVIVRKRQPYEAEEGCLSLGGVRKTTRYKEIEVTYLDGGFRPRRTTFRDWTAQIIQHEVDHCDGILI
ncbi:MAG: peptide deformylase [Clostridia bacterium]|nr:peptide deformylase [Clostridia bacterium]